MTPSTSSYPGTPPERGSPHAPAPAHPPRNYSDIMRSLAARYNTHPTNEYVSCFVKYCNGPSQILPQHHVVIPDHFFGARQDTRARATTMYLLRHHAFARRQIEHVPTNEYVSCFVKHCKGLQIQLLRHVILLEDAAGAFI